MIQFLKNNKYKIIILPVVLLFGMFVSGCVNTDANAKENSDFTKNNMYAGTKVGTVTDKETGVQYLVVEGMDGGPAITPRLNRDGRVMTNN